LLARAVAASRIDHARAVAMLADVILTGRDQRPPLLGGLEPPMVAWYPPMEVDWMTPGARRAAAQALRQASPHEFPAGLDRAGQLALSALRTVGRTARADVEIAAAHGVRLHNPYLDSRVLDAVAAVPAWRRTSPAAFKPLLLDAFPGLLPQVVAARTTKGSYEADHYRGLRANLTSLRRFVDGRLARLGLISPGPLGRTLDLAAAGLPVPVAGLEQVITTEVWLRAVESTPPTRWVRTRGTVTA
jgi:asparagine synthase (glutamine-hydrolysing)